MDIPHQSVRMPILLALLGVFVAGGGCGGGNPDAGEAIPDDIAIQIVANPARLHAPTRWHLRVSPIHDWGGLKNDPADEFEHRNGYLSATLKANGILVVIDRSRILEYNPDGSELATFGRTGSGPEEFRGLRLMCAFHADTMAVYDFINGRLSIIAPGAKQVTTSLIAGQGALLDSPCLGDGTLVRQHQDGIVERFNRAGTPIDTIGTFPRGRDSNGITTNAILLASAGRLISGVGTQPYFTIVDVGSGTRRKIMFDEVAPGDFTAPAAEPRFDGASPAQRAESEAEARRAATMEVEYTFFDRIVAGTNGDAWIRDPLPASDHVSSEWWTRFDAAGHISGRLEIPAPPYDTSRRDAAGRPPPPPFRPVLLQGNDSTVLLLRRDDEGAVHFSEYGLVLDK